MKQFVRVGRRRLTNTKQFGNTNKSIALDLVIQNNQFTSLYTCAEICFNNFLYKLMSVINFFPSILNIYNVFSNS